MGISPSTPPTGIPWGYADLRLIDPSDAPLPEQDLLAVYLRRSKSRAESRWEVRLDFLQMTIRSSDDIYLALDYSQGGDTSLPFASTASLRWDALIHLPATGEITAHDSQGRTLSDLSLLVQRDSPQASLVISFDGAALYSLPGAAAPPEIALQVFLVSPETGQVLDQTEPLRSAAQPPPPARLLLVFDHTFPAYTPAQALRRWDGAHTGPAGGRHGLGNLLRLARNRSIPLVLLDLGFPSWLSALDYADGLDQVLASLATGDLILPNWTPPVGDPQISSASFRRIAQKYHLSHSQFGYTNFLPDSPPSERLLFLPVRSDSPISTLYRQGQRRILPVPLAAASQPELQPDQNGLSLRSRRLLIDVALSAARQPASVPILVLGGDLTRSSWGIPEVARAAFAEIQNRPWIQPLNAYDLLSLPPASPLPELQPLYPNPPQTVVNLPWEWLFSSPKSDPLLDAARQAALLLLTPAPPDAPEFAALQEIYARQVHVLLAASRWSQNPQPAATCAVDLDLDGARECLLASHNLYLVFEPDLCALTHAFWLAADGPHQLIAPTAQLAFALGDPSEWEASRDLAADPQVIPGAFYDGAGACQAQVSPAQLTLIDPAGALLKRFSLLPDGLRVEYQTDTPLAARLPLSLDPWRRFQPGWGDLYRGRFTSAGYIWEIDSGVSLQLTNAPLSVSAFNETRHLMGRQEDPNSEFPPAHYLPFPLALAEVTGRGDFWVELRPGVR